jgi:hypothetical protein
MMRFFLLILGIGLLLISCSKPYDESKVLDYDHVPHESDYSYSNVIRARYSYLLTVTTIPTKEELDATATSIWCNNERRKRVDEMTIWLALPGMDHSKSPYYLATFNNKGMIESQIVKENLFSNPSNLSTE